MALNSKDYNEKREHIIKLQTALIESGQFPTCTNCETWEPETEVCRKWNARPPANVIVVGCVEYIDKIPF